MTDPERWIAVPLTAEVDLQHGGRWTSLRAGDREWLWTHPDAGVAVRRRAVRPGEPFVDAGGIEEALPTVRGLPDHGDVWDRPWTAGPGTSGEVMCGLAAGTGPVRGRLRRTLTVGDGPLRADYLITGPAGASFVHAVHALLEVSSEAQVEPVGPVDAVVLDEHVPGRSHPITWPSGLDRLGPDDGTAVCVLLRGCRGVRVVDEDHRLDLTWSSDAPERCSLLLWRNLRGWPPGDPYRSIGVEPMVGRSAELGSARAEDRVILPADGRFGWSLTVRAARRVRADREDDGHGES